MKRAENCEGCKIDHIYWSADSLVFEFAKSKGDQDGKFVGPWHCYSNPESPHLCVVLALAKYCLTYQEVLIRGAPLFEGMSQYDRYAKAFRAFMSTHAERLRELGVKLVTKGSCYDGCCRLYSFAANCFFVYSSWMGHGWSEG